MIGSMPQADPGQACALVRRHLPQVPAWPQLPRRSFMENMYVQFSQGFPGIELDMEAESIWVDRARDLAQPLEALYAAYLGNDLEHFAIGADYAAGLHVFLDTEPGSALVVKGQVTGPVSWGLTVTDQERRPVLYDDTLADALAKHLRLKAAWQERQLERLRRPTVIFIDEPYMASFGSAFVSLERQQVTSLLEEVLGGIAGIKGVHCCGNTDWSLLLGTSVNILSLDAYGFAHTLALYPDEVKAFLGKGGVIAWGIVPNEEALLEKESAASLADRLEDGAIAPLARKGVPYKQLQRQALLTPGCGLSGLSLDASEHALELLASLSQRLRQRYC
ncbi:MAG: methionine synthase [Chloroflexi bacterium]|nr:methionine synthase [Chloroflexota bacterium]